MPSVSLDRLISVSLRDIWKTEAGDFTPWLAQQGNLDVLGETLAIDLELEAQEKSVGPFRADLLCKDIGTDNWVLIENQLEKTDHIHLGQLLTYASGLEAVTIVWISSKFTEEHRSTLDWLNKITNEDFRFFGLEVELWRIGSSMAAPKFNIVSKPNNWSRSVAKAARGIDESELSASRIMQIEYWDEFHKALDVTGGPISGARKPQPQPWMAYSIGRSGFSANSVMVKQKNCIRVELYIGNDQANQFFNLLNSQKEQVERELGYALEWQDLPNGRDCRIARVLENVEPEDRADWPRQHEWLAKNLNDLHRVFFDRVRSLNADDWSEEEPIPTDQSI